MSEYWLISAPGEKTCQQTFDTMNNLTSKQNNLCNNYKFHIPDLKVGTLDQLVGLSDDLGKLDTYVEQITRKVASYLGEVLEDQRDKLHENLLANNSPGPPDDTATLPPNPHSDLTGKSSNLSNSRDTTTTTCSACHSGSFNNLSSTEEESERDYDLMPSPGACNCDECTAAPAATVTATSALASTGTPMTVMMTRSNSGGSSSTGVTSGRGRTNRGSITAAALVTATTTSLMIGGASAAAAAAIDDDYCLSPSFTSNSLFTVNSNATAITTCAITGSASKSTSVSSPPPTAAMVNNFSFASYCSTTEPSTASLVLSGGSGNGNGNGNGSAGIGGSGSVIVADGIDPAEHKISNNNTCCINNNRLSGSSDHHNHHHNSHQHQQQQHHHHHYHHQQQQHQRSFHHPVSSNDDGNDGGHLKGNQSPSSDISDTFDWWFHRQKRSSKKSRSSPVSSCCGNSSRGRSSPDTDTGEPPAFPLSPADLSVYITRFQWDMAKYPIKQSLRNIADIISKQVGQIDADLKTKSSAYNNLKGSLQNLEKKQTGSLLTRNLADLVKKEHFILDSEYLTTLLVIVPKMMANEWLANYEKITDMIVPRSSALITQDNDYCLFNVTLFKKVVEEFKLHARERKFIVRDFVYNEEELAAGKNEMTKLITDKKKQFGPLVRWLKVNFSEAFCALIHVKALRVFVESVLRYGLPVNFQAILIEPNKKSMKRLRDCLNQLYGHLDGASAAGQGSNSADTVDIPGLGFGQSEYFPYVFYKINVDMVEQSKI